MTDEDRDRDARVERWMVFGLLVALTGVTVVFLVAVYLVATGQGGP